MTGFAVLDGKLDALLHDVRRLEQFSHGARATYIGGGKVLVRVVVANANIAFIVEAQDKLLTPWFMATGGYETDLTNFLVHQLTRTSHCLDVGANFGYFTCLMARFCPEGRVIGVEADEAIYELARDNIAINGFSGFAQARQAAVGDTNDAVTLYRRTGRSGNTSITAAPRSLTLALGEPPVEPFQIAGLRVDDLLEPFDGRLDFMKVDVEGAEPLVFRGAVETIARNPQLVTLMEWAPHQISQAGFSISEFLGELDRMDLDAFDLVEGVERPLGFDGLAVLPYRAGVILRRRG